MRRNMSFVLVGKHQRIRLQKMFRDGLGVEMIELTDRQIEDVQDQLKQAGFEFPDDWDYERMACLIESVLDGLEIEY